MFELEEVRTWERNPQYYGDILASSLAAQALFMHAPATERARRVLSKLRQTPRLIQAARDNIKDLRHLREVESTMRGLIHRARCRARLRRDDLVCWATWLTPRLSRRSSAYVGIRRAPRPRFASAFGREVENKWASEGCRCRRSIMAFHAGSGSGRGGRMNGGDPPGVGANSRHPVRANCRRTEQLTSCARRAPGDRHGPPASRCGGAHPNARWSFASA
jgi:hypothetical protein